MSNEEKTSYEDMGDYRARESMRNGRLKKPLVAMTVFFAPSAVMIFVAVVFLSYQIWGQVYLLKFASLAMIILGTIQILLGALLKTSDAFHLRKLILQENIKRTIYWRENDVIRFMLGVIDKIESGKMSTASIRDVYISTLNENHTEGGILKIISQRDLADIMLTNSYDVTYGTVLVVLGTIGGSALELFKACH